MISEVPASATSSRSSSRIWAWIVTSSAVVGSSQMSSRGSQASAVAMSTRWRMPPESWWGYSPSRRAGSGMPTRRSRVSAAVLASPLQCPRCRGQDLGDLQADGDAPG